VVRFSRLIGKIDTTGSRTAAQVAPLELSGTAVTALQLFGAGGSTLAFSTERAKRHSFEWRFASLRWSLASQQIMGGGYIHRAFYRLSRPVCRYVDGCSCRASAVFAGSPECSSSRYITGTLTNSYRRAVLNCL